MSSGETPHSSGLCDSCRHARRVRTPRSSFWLCERSQDDASYDRYPRLPVLACRGFEPGEPVASDVLPVDEGISRKK